MLLVPNFSFITIRKLIKDEILIQASVVKIE